MTKKYYAVKKGYVPGIYSTWDDCRKQVSGFPGATYKGFPTREEAESYLGEQKTEKVESASENQEADYTPEAVAYVDGSYGKDEKTFSYGVVMLYDGKEEHFSNRMNTEALLEMRNVAGEIKAAEFAMQFCVQNGIKTLDLYPIFPRV